MHIPFIFKSNKILVGFCIVLFTFFNINKSFQVDDTFYIEEARWIIQNPTHPLSGEINWMDSSKPIFTENNPILIPYIIAFIIKLFGENVVSLHLITLFFLLIFYYYTHKVLEFLNTNNKLNYFLLFILNPALILNQNIMLEVPLWCFLMGILYYCLSSIENPKSQIKISILFSLAVLTKYSIFPFFTIILIYAYLKKNLRILYMLLLPIITILIWSLWNIYDFGQIHLFSKKESIHFELDKILSLILCIGSISSFSICLIWQKLYGINGKRIFVVIFSLLFLMPSILYLLDLLQYEYYFYANTIYCGINGCLILWFCFHYKKYIKSNFLPFLFALVIYLLFLLFTSPFIATRHFIIFFLFIGLILISTQKLPRWLLLLNLIWTLLISYSDFQYAQYYENMAHFISKKFSSTTIYTVGHNGWQYYSKKEGMRFYDINTSHPKTDNIIIVPVNTHNQKIDSSLLNYKYAKIFSKPKIGQFFIGRKNAPYGSNYMNFIPFIFSKKPIDTFIVYRIH